ncbi:hypothetical protein CERZMDRAFT_90876 [Cercospora zeae-maydis SCOH1-5]|uniref:Uncharacterized protein n=1 Tax=Cercospora zeae-maydis SCOH1-5 TaxID=717836 RepID=A0A6A6FEE4_9PEZI|nr:hypothetical protein CERZMDRAFT_90876 [Cercospora zeae-maydis SCOH1-5]
MASERRDSTFLSLAPMSYSNWVAPAASPPTPLSAKEEDVGAPSPTETIEAVKKSHRSASESSNTSAFLRLGHVDKDE